MSPRFNTLCLIVVALTGCANDLDGIHYTSEASVTQVVQLIGQQPITVICYCSTYTVRGDGKLNELQLYVSGTYSIAGYHGTREDAGAVPLKADELKFKETRTADSITLISPEWRHIHHQLIIHNLQIVVPHGYALKVEQISLRQLSQLHKQ